MTSINYCNYDNGDEVIISKCSGEQQEVVVDAAVDADADVCAQPKHQSYNNIKKCLWRREYRSYFILQS